MDANGEIIPTIWPMAGPSDQEQLSPSSDIAVDSMAGIAPESTNPEFEAADVESPAFSLKALKKYLNPIIAGRAYGRFVKRTFKNFGLAEVNSTLAVLASGYLANRYVGDAADGWVTAVATAAGENIGFYGTTATKKYREVKAKYSLTPREAIRETVRHHGNVHLVTEIVDQGSRPFSMWLGLKGLGGLLGLVGGKLLADHVSYGILDYRERVYGEKAGPRLAGYVTEQAAEIAEPLQEPNTEA